MRKIKLIDVRRLLGATALIALLCAAVAGTWIARANAQVPKAVYALQAPARASETERPHATETERPEATETERPHATETERPEATETERPHATETERPEATETERPHATETERPEATETERPHETQTVLPRSSRTPDALPGSGSRTFPETGKSVSGLFLQYWTNNGGLTQQGFPISAVMLETSPLNGKSYTVQYFERSVLEYHPENKPPFDVLLSQLGTFQYKARYASGAPNQKVNQANGRYFSETKHWVGGLFLQYWTNNGGLAQQGFPISDEFTEVSPLNGKSYTVQYFERSVLEYHPENKPPFDVLLSQLGTFQYKARYGSK